MGSASITCVQRAPSRGHAMGFRYTQRRSRAASVSCENPHTGPGRRDRGMPDTEDSIGPARGDDAGGEGGQREINEYFDATSSYWDAVYRDDDLQARIYKRRQEYVLAAVAAVEPRPARVLEVGCGAG